MTTTIHDEIRDEFERRLIDACAPVIRPTVRDLDLNTLDLRSIRDATNEVIDVMLDETHDLDRARALLEVAVEFVNDSNVRARIIERVIAQARAAS